MFNTQYPGIPQNLLSPLAQLNYRAPVAGSQVTPAAPSPQPQKQAGGMNPMGLMGLLSAFKGLGGGADINLGTPTGQGLLDMYGGPIGGADGFQGFNFGGGAPAGQGPDLGSLIGGFQGFNFGG